MMTSSNGNIFRVTGHLCGEFTDPHYYLWTTDKDNQDAHKQDTQLKCVLFLCVCFLDTT